MASTVFKIENGVLALTLVDTAAIGYLPSWQAPAGAEVFEVTIADYTTTPAKGSDLSCQVTSGALNASPNTTTDTTPATFCGPEVNTTSVGVTSYVLDSTILQDPNVSAGVSAYLFEHDTKEAYFYLGLAGDNLPPAAIGRCRIVAGAFGGDARVSLTATLSLPVSSKPDAWYGTDALNRVVKGDGSTVVVPPLAARSSTSTESSESSEPVLEDANA